VTIIQEFEALNGTIDDLKFLEIKCGKEILPYQWINGSVVLEDYSCDEVGSETTQVFTEGVHTLEFRFGNDVEYAYNDAVGPSALQVC